MRFMALVKADNHSEAGDLPSPELMARMGAFVEEIAGAGVLLATDGLHPSSKGSRLQLAGGKRTVTDGPFAETKELIASYALIEVKSKEEALEWSWRFLEVLGEGNLELRPVFEAEDFPADLFPPEAAAREGELRQELQARVQSL